MTNSDNESSDESLWKQLTGETKKLDSPERIRPETKVKAPSAPVRHAAPPPSVSRPKTELISGDLTQMDGANAERLRKGKYPIDRKVDLHGCTQEQAFTRLLSAVQSGFTQGLRCLLVVTGKGKDKDPEGVLKGQLPHWMNAPDIRPYILAYSPAQPQDGGTGAYYVLLRRQR